MSENLNTSGISGNKITKWLIIVHLILGVDE